MTTASPRITGPSAAPERTGLSRLFAGFAPYASIFLGILAVVLIWVGAYAHITRERTQDERAALQNAKNLTRAIEEQVIRTLRAADQTLIYFRDSFEKNKGQIDVAIWARPYPSLTDLILQVAVIDRNGIVVASNIESHEIVDVSDREHFRVHAHRDTDELFISKPIIGRVSGRQSFQLTRRIRADDGGFGGVMVLALAPESFARFFDTIDLGSKGSISLIGTDGIIRAQGTNERVPTGNSIAAGRLMREFAQARSGSFLATSSADGVERYITYREVKGYPLIVSVDLAADDVLAWFYQTRLLRILAACLLTAVIIPLVILIMHHEKGLARARDAAEAGTRARTDFLAVMSHEIRTPMNAVLGFADVLLESKLDAEQRRAVMALHASGDDLLRLLSDILDFTRLDSGRVSFEAIPFAPAGVTESAVNAVGPDAIAKGLTLRVESDPDLPLALVGDAGRLRQVLLNLLSNAVKFTHRGEIVVAVRCLARDADRATVEWSVTDSGIGIAPERIGEMFSDFVQADSSINRCFGGAGLGLAICRRIIGQMGGTIDARSAPGAGSTFAFAVALPLGALPAEAEAETETVAETGAEHATGDVADELRRRIVALGRPLRLLLAEDNPTNQLVCRQMLRDFDIAVSIASNGREAVRAVADFCPDVVLMDLQMPGVNGIQATREIRARFGTGLPIVALTANAYPEDAKACLDAGMNGFIAKPARKRVLAEAILGATQGGIGAPAAKMPGTVFAPAPGSRLEAEAIVDREVIGEFIGEVGAIAAAEILKTYLSETERRLSILRELAVDQREAIHLEAHTLKGSSGIFGLPRLSGVARMLERNAASITAEEYPAALIELEAAYAESKVELAVYLQEAPAGIAPDG